jgi:glycerol-3-phosphate dehydrogenase
VISRDIAAAARREFDLVIVGGGIYGVSLLREAARRGLSACLCEAGDFGGGTSWNSLRIVHGGLRYLQTLDLSRFFQSVAARRRVALQFPTLVRPLDCLMPLYGQGMKRVSVMRIAMFMNDFLSWHRNNGVAATARLPGGGVLDAAATRSRFPQVRGARLEGAAHWSDLFMISSERILMELLSDACRAGAVAVNYAPVLDILSDGRVARGVRVRDLVSGAEHSITARAVVNCAGPQVRSLARGRGGDAEQLFRPSLAFNIMLDLALPTERALAVAAPQPGAPVLFLLPGRGTLLAGTVHLPRPAETTEAVPTEAEILQFLAELNQAVPGLNARLGNVRRVFAGLLPAAVAGSNTLVKREVLVDHGKTGGPDRLYSVSGVKFTTAEDVARQTLAMMRMTGMGADEVSRLALSPATAVLTDAQRFLEADAEAVKSALQQVIEEEAVHCQDDLILRRTNWATTEADLERVRARVAQLANLPAGMPRSLKCA